MTLRLSDKLVRGIEPPATGARITYDADVAGFGARVTAAGSRSFVLNYRTQAGRERRYTIGGFPAWGTAAARKFAADLKARIRQGYDPLAELEAARAAPTVNQLCDRFVADYLPRLRPATAIMYTLLLDGPKPDPRRGKPRAAAFEGLRKLWGARAVEEITHADVDALHRRVSRGARYTANRLVALLSRLFGLAVRWGWRTDNPARGVERNQEVKRQRFLTPAELSRLAEALAAFPDRQAADIVALLVLTGARSHEVLAMRWDQLDLAVGVWTKPGAATKQKSEHRVPLSAAARQVLAGIPQEGAWVFPSASAGGHRMAIKSAWPRVCEAAGFIGPGGRPNLRVHDLRHTFASVLAGAGMSLPVIGALLGHSQPATTARYAHLLDDPLRAATERAGVIVTGR